MTFVHVVQHLTCGKVTHRHMVFSYIKCELSYFTLFYCFCKGVDLLISVFFHVFSYMLLSVNDTTKQEIWFCKLQLNLICVLPLVCLIFSLLQFDSNMRDIYDLKLHIFRTLTKRLLEGWTHYLILRSSNNVILFDLGTLQTHQSI